MRRSYIVVALAALVYFSNLGGTSIYILDEAKNAGCAMEMRDRGDWIIPTFNGKLRTDKPPLHYFFMMGSYSVFGLTPFAARFFSAIAGVIMVIVVYRNVRRLVNETSAFFTSLVILSSIQLTVQFHLAVPDPYLILFITISLFSFFNGYHHSPKQMTWLYVASALGFMTKGLIAVVLPGLIIVLYLLFTRSLNSSAIRKMKIPMGILLFSIIALPWYAAVGYFTDGLWLKGFFIEHNFDRYTSTMEGHRGFPFAPFVILIAALLPFSVFIFQSVRLTWQERKRNPFLLFSLITGIVFAGFFSFSKTILPSYPAPSIPFLAVVIGYFLYRLGEGKNFSPGGLWAGVLLNMLISVVLCIAAYHAINMEKSIRELNSVIWIFLVLPIGSVAGCYFFLRQKISLFVYSWAASWILLGLLFFYVAYPRIDAKNPVSASLDLIHSQTEHRIVGYHIFNPAYVFALHHPIEVIDSGEELQNLLETGTKILVITREKYRKEFPSTTDLKVIYSGRDLFEKNETVILAN